MERLVTLTEGVAPADIEAIVQAAKRFAFGRCHRDDRLPPLETQDFERSLERVQPVRYPEPVARTAQA
jgi:SpoVK/Ycf46/Vps4 family AAA+-type ATPase